MKLADDFKHGGDLKQFASQQNCKIKDIVDLSSNINFIKPYLDININNIDISSYPNYDKLYNSISKYLNTKSKNIELFNGGSSAIFSLMRFFKQKRCYIYSPAYLEYKKAALLNDKKTALINRYANIYKKVKKNSIVVFVNPSTPDGVYYDMEKLLKYWAKQNCKVIIDESFIEFTHHKSVQKNIKKYKNLFILKSMTKFYSCAGLRMGIVISNSKNIKRLKHTEPLWKLSTYDSVVIQKLIKDEKFKIKTLKENKKAKNYLLKIIKKYSFLNLVQNSNANFILVKLNHIKKEYFVSHLAQYNIMIRDCSNFDFLSDGYIRIAVKSKKNMKRFKKALDNIVL
jgi:threonine-phosphate decarboxylase